MKTAAIIYTLITVTNGATVHQESGFKSLRTCEEAKSLALYGLSIDEKAARDAEAKRKAEEARQKEEERQAAWDKEHPPRLPANACEKAVAETGGWSYPSECPNVRQVTKGVVRDEPPNGYKLTGPNYCIGCGVPPPDPTKIKAALCVVEP